MENPTLPMENRCEVVTMSRYAFDCDQEELQPERFGAVAKTSASIT